MQLENLHHPFGLCTVSCLALSLAMTFNATGQTNSSDYAIRSFELISAEEARLTLDTPADMRYQFWFSTNLNEWDPAEPLSPVSYDGETATYRVDIHGERPMAVYRAAYQSIPPNPVPLTELVAPEEDPVIQHLPDMGVPFENETEEVSKTHGLPVSLAHLLVHFDSATTVAEFNECLTQENLSLAGAVTPMQLGILRRNVISGLGDLQATAERLESTGWFSAVAFNLGETLPRIASPSQLQPHAAGRQQDSINWTWEWSPLGTGFSGNNPLEMSRIPQLWNWLDYGFRQRDFEGGHVVAVLEFAFNSHLDLPPSADWGNPWYSSLSQRHFDHGTAVLGVIGAQRNGIGIEGVTPLPDLIKGIPFLPNLSTTNIFAGTRLGQLASALIAAEPPKVINISSGFPWSEAGSPSTTNEDAGITYGEWMDKLGALYASCIQSVNRNTSRSNYLIVCAAGNDNEINAVYNSPYCNVACRPELQIMAPQFLAVENVMEDRQPAPSSSYDYSGVGDSVSAGGTDVTVLAGPSNDSYRRAGGTSISAPLVSGLASFLWSLEPSLTIQGMKSLLLSSNTTFEVQGGERANLVDGFSAALELDRLRQNDDMHRALVDVDDGTLDGNLREEIVYFSEDPDQIHTYDGRRGDGHVNMKDFRVFRDAWLHVIGETDYLDGPPTHFKRDLNFDGLVFDQAVSPAHPAPYDIRTTPGESLLEMVYSRYDFNGNGLLDQENESASPPVESLAPFKTDPDTVVTGRSIADGFYRDIDVLLHKAVWEQDEENVVLSGAPSSRPQVFPHEWTTNNVPTLTVSYLRSFDFHIDMDEGNTNAATDDFTDTSFAVTREGLHISDWFGITKERMGEWAGVITIPYSEFLDFPTISVDYKISVDEEFHSYSIHFVAKPGEDIGLALGFDDLQFYSNSRDFSAFYTGDSGNPVSQEAIGRRPGAEPYDELFIPREEHTQEEEKRRARDLAISLLAERLKFPVALNGSPSIEPVYSSESANDGINVKVYGIIAEYDDIVGSVK